MHRSIAFDGAARTVTGSRHLLTIGGKKVLVDCGLFQGAREVRDRNWESFPFDAAEIEAVLLTHAHTDHVGLLPRLVKQGFRRSVYATSGTISLANVALPDGGRLQEEEARYHNRHGTAKHDPALPLFTEADAYDALKLLEKVHYHEPLKLPNGATARYIPAGHILGASHIEVTFADGTIVVFSGDVGRYDRPILRDPSEVYAADYIVLESTYGDRLHTKEDVQTILADLINECAKKRSVILVPSFAIGRTQELLWNIHLLIEDMRIPRVPIYVDSPMATETTLLYTDHVEDHDKEMKVHMKKGESPLSPELVHFVRDRNMSKALNQSDGPMMVIAGSGMVNGGRILHHLRHRLADPDNVVLFTGYQAEGTRGRDMIEGEPTVRIFGEEVPVRARIEKLNSLSAHADYEELFRWLSHLHRPPKRVFLVHGDYEVQQRFRDKIVERLGWQVDIPAPGDVFAF
jgi:metallo-beta-lactamase family protein